MIKLFAFLLLRNTTSTKWSVIDKNRNMPFINTIRVKPFFSPDGEEYIIDYTHVETPRLDRPQKTDKLPLVQPKSRSLP